MADRRIIGYRTHPVFRTLMQEIYECGHVRSAPAEELELAEGQQRRCIKCVKGMPADVSFGETRQRLPEKNNETPLVERLCSVLTKHLQETELNRRKIRGELPDLDAAIIEAHNVLKQAGFPGTCLKYEDR